MKLIIETDEIFPVYSLLKPYMWSEEIHEIDEQVYQDYIRIQYEYNAMQKKLGELHERSEARNIQVA